MPGGWVDSALRDKDRQWQQLFLAVMRSSNRAKGKGEDFTAHQASGNLSIQTDFLLAAS